MNFSYFNDASLSFHLTVGKVEINIKRKRNIKFYLYTKNADLQSSKCIPEY